MSKPSTQRRSRRARISLNRQSGQQQLDVCFVCRRYVEGEAGIEVNGQIRHADCEA